MYKSGWIVLNNVPTCVRTWGNWINDEIKSDSVIILITGNPGISDFYKKFLLTLNTLINVPVWVISHAGSQIPPDSENLLMPSLKKNPDLFDLDAQIKHKEEFISTYIPESKKIYLIGHSIGGKISVELLKKPKIAERVKQVHLICPTLQYIADTPNGRTFRYFLTRISPFLISLAWLFTFLPFQIRAFFVRLIVIMYSLSLKIETCCVNGLLKLFTPKALKSVFFLANDEMDKVKELDNQVYANSYDKIHTYFGQSDNWAPLYQYEDLKKRHPQVHSMLFDPNITHSFVFTSSEAVAEKLAAEIKRNM